MAGYRYSVKYFLQKSEPKTEPTQLRCYIRYDSRLVIVGTGIKIKPVDWNADKQEPRQRATLLNASELKTDLENITRWVSDEFDRLTAIHKEYPAEGDLKKNCKELIKNKGPHRGAAGKEKPTSLTAYIDKYIEDAKTGRRTKANGEAFNNGTVKHYKSAAGVLNRYAASINKKELYFTDISVPFYNDFKKWAFNLEQPYSDNYFGAVIKFLKTCMSEAAEDGLHTNNSFKNKRFVKITASVENVYLNIEQLTIIQDADLKGNLKLDRVRDLFLVGCWTGLRFSDFTNIKPDNIDERFIRIKTQKTGGMVAIPIHSTVKAIMAKYADKTPNSLPPSITNQKMNAYLKELIKEVGLTEMVTINKRQGGKVIKVESPLYELVSTHTARRSFATNMFMMGIPTILIMGITGHKTETSFHKYIKVSPVEKAELMQSAWNRLEMKAV